MSSKIWLINLVLAAVVMFFGLKAYEVWSGEKMRPSQTGSLKSPPPWPEKKIAKKSVLPESDYGVIVSSSLFHASRSETNSQEQKKKQPVVERKADGKRLQTLEWSYKNTNLYGVVIVDDHREALIGEVPAGTGRGTGERGVKRAKVGDIVGRFKVKEIKSTSVLLTAEGHEWRVSLFDKDKPKKRVQVKKNDGPIVIVGGSKTGSIVKEAKVVEKRRTPKPAVSKKKTLPKAQNKKRTIPVPTDRSRTRKR